LALILNIETATTNCSVSISENENIICTMELDEGYSHAENLHPFIQKVLTDSKLEIGNLHAVSVSCGPGSYTGLRIGVSAAKGICYALNIPLISINTLKVLSKQVAEDYHETDMVLCPMLDARRMEVYSAVYDLQLNEIRKTEANIIDESSVTYFTFNKPTLFFGNGMPKCKELFQAIPNSQFIENLIPTSKNMAQISFDLFQKKQFEDVAYFEPFYLKDFYFKTK